MGSYRSLVDKECLACPSNTYTLSTGSTSLTDCLCLDGYTTTAGGSCIDYPACRFHPCDPLSLCTDIMGGPRNSSGRTCSCPLGFEGTGEPGECSACLANTYRSSLDQESCMACPDNSTSLGNVGTSSLDFCYCDEEFEKV
eukprot:Lithocolla_globosa_v1_NODE_677_length_3456_cov_131.371328.p2 type:complete len:141 gc:universal NODE_677_length_3456_cov_131.371328:1203-1625(+)